MNTICQQCKGEGHYWCRPLAHDSRSCEPNSNIPIMQIVTCDNCDGKGIITPEIRKRYYDSWNLN